MKKMKVATRTMAVLAVAAACALASVSPALAEGDSTEKLASTTKTYGYMESTGDDGTYAKTIEEGGITYDLIDRSDAVDTEWQPGVVSFTRSQTVQCWPADLDVTISGFASTWRIEEGGVAGDIPQTSVTYAPVNGVREYQADAVVTISGLPTNDVNQIPASDSFTLDTGNVRTLDRAGITWSVDATDSNGMPTSYTATVIYRGVDTQTVLDHYDVTASYAGDIAASTDVRHVVTLAYQQRPAPEPEPEPVVEPEPEPEPEAPFPWAAVAGAGAAVVALAGGAVVVVRLRNTKIAYLDGESMRIIGRLRAKRCDDGHLEVTVPPKYDLSSKQHYLIPRLDLTGKARLVAVQMGRTHYDGPALSLIELEKYAPAADAKSE